MQQEFGFACMIVRVMEGKLINNQQWQRLIQSKDLEECEHILRETHYGEAFNKLNRPENFDQALDSEFARQAEELNRLVEDEALRQFLFLKYDLHNLKILIKQETEIKGKENVREKDLESLLFPYSTLYLPLVKSWIRHPQTNPEWTALQKAVSEGVRCWQKTQDAQSLDFVLDSWYYRMMDSLAKEIQSDFLTGYKECLADASNVLSFFRARRQKQSKNFIAEVLVEGGSLADDEFLSLGDRDASSAIQLFSKSALSEDYLRAVRHYYESGNISALERARDEFTLTLADQALLITEGPEPLVGYMIKLENEMTNLRILLSGKDSGLSAHEIEERMRMHA